MLICDGHNSHISATFIYHCIQNRIVLLLLPPHSSHLMQLLDVGVFGPLKMALFVQLACLISIGVPRLQKIEWLENYVFARAKAITPANIEGGWRGAGIFPINCAKILCNMPRELTTQSLHQPQM
jgi:DDE superfamily endonuclease